MTPPSDRASVREAAAEYYDHDLDADGPCQPSAQAERDVPALTLERVREVLREHQYREIVNVLSGCKCGWRPLITSSGHVQWVEHILALLAAPETEKPNEKEQERVRKEFYDREYRKREDGK